MEARDILIVASVQEYRYCGDLVVAQTLCGCGCAKRLDLSAARVVARRGASSTHLRGRPSLRISLPQVAADLPGHPDGRGGTAVACSSSRAAQAAAPSSSLSPGPPGAGGVQRSAARSHTDAHVTGRG
eukprot:scaffold1766_cov401-Prasinococcus_capsulatus_cf.AAC.3